MRRVENAPTGCRARKWPGPKFPQKIPKKILNSERKNTPKTPRKKTKKKKAPKYPNTSFGGSFSVLHFSGVPEFQPGGHVFGISLSVAGRGVLKRRAAPTGPRMFVRKMFGGHPGMWAYGSQPVKPLVAPSAG